jgi:hypothetical protein
VAFSIEAVRISGNQEGQNHMKNNEDLLNKTKVYALRVILAGILVLITGTLNTRPALQVAAQGLEQGASSGLSVRNANIALTTVAAIDDFPGAEVLSLPYQDLNLNISTATSEVYDPTSIILGDCNSDRGEASVWYSYNPGGQDAYVSMDTIGSDYDTVLAVWTGIRWIFICQR